MSEPQPLSRHAGLMASVCICTYNGRARIAAVVDALGRQTLGRDSWELLVIDNASTDGTGDHTAALLQEFFPENGRVVHEEKPGLSFARARAAKEARGPIICFLDDDNLPDPEFVKSAVRAFETHPQAGCIGGKVLPKWEAEPTPLALGVANYALAICDYGDAPFRYQGLTSGPVGAGVCARRDLLLDFYEDADFARLTGRKGASLASGEDTALILRIHQAGYEAWYEPSLRMFHCLSAKRMQKDYLLSLYEEFGRADPKLRRLFDWKARIRALEFMMGVKELLRWGSGQILGPSQQLRKANPQTAHDLHELGQRMLLGRALQYISGDRFR